MTGGLAADPDKVLASMDWRKLMSVSRWSRHVVLVTVKKSDDPEIDAAVYAATIAEVSAKWASGPYTMAELDFLLGPLWVPSRRFVIRQGSKI